MLELEACRIIFPFPPAILNPHQHHSLNGPFPLQPLVELLSVSLSFAINGTLVFKEPTHVHIYIPFTLIVASHICIYWARLILRHSGNSSETLVLKHSIGIWWAWKDCECLASFFFFFLPFLVLGSMDLLSSVIVHMGLSAACGENFQPSLLVDLFINGLRVLCVLKMTLLHHGNCTWHVSSALTCNYKI